MEISCTQCGARLTIDADARLLECSFCSTALVVDPTGVVFNEVMRPTVDASQAQAHLRRFLASSATVAGLDRQAVIAEAQLEYFPFWAFTVQRGPDEEVVLMPASPSSLQGLHGVSLPGGDSCHLSKEVTGDAPVVQPEVPLATAQQWLVDQQGQVAVKRTVLFHLPLYLLTYTWKGRSFRAAVDGVTGKVFPAEYPSKAEAPYYLVAGLAIAVFTVEGFVFSNLLLKLVAYCISAVPILVVAWFTCRKV